MMRGCFGIRLLRPLAFKLLRFESSFGLRTDSKVNPFVYQDLFRSRSYEHRLLNTVREELATRLGPTRTPIKIDIPRIPSLSDRELVDALKEALWLNAFATDKRLKVALKNECFHRQSSKFDNVCMFYCADILKKTDFYFDEYMSAISKTLMFKWDNMMHAKEDVLLLAHFLTNSKSLALMPVMDKVEKYLRENISEFLPREVGLVCYLFFSTNTRLKEFGSLDALAKFVLDALSRTSPMYFTDINNIIKVLRHANFVDVPFFTELGDKLCGYLKEHPTSHVNLSNLAFTYASLHIQHDGLLDEVTRIFCNKVDAGSHDGRDSRSLQSVPRLKDLSRLLWSRTTFCMDVPVVLRRELLACLHSDPSQAFQYPEIFVEAQMALAVNKTYDLNSLKILYSKDFLEFKQKRQLEQNYQLLLLNEANRIEGGVDTKSLAMPEKYLDSLKDEVAGNLKYELSTRQGLPEIIATLHELLGDWSLFKVDFILSYSKITDIELLVNEKGHPLQINKLPYSDELLELMKPKNTYNNFSIISQILNSQNVFVADRCKPIHLKHEKPSFPRKIVIKVLGSNQFAKNTATLIGQHELELRLLHNSGYDVYAVDPFTAHKLRTLSESQRHKVVQEILSKCGVTVKS